MPESHLSYDVPSEALLNLHHLQLMLDFSAVLVIDYEGRPADTKVSLIKEPTNAFESLVTAYLADEGNRDKVKVRWYHCPVCNRDYSGRKAGEGCPTTEWSGEGGPLYRPCGGRLQEVVEKDPSEVLLRERASLRFYETVECTRSTVSSWVAQNCLAGRAGDDDFW
jgi:hypothetical protein